MTNREEIARVIAADPEFGEIASRADCLRLADAILARALPAQGEPVAWRWKPKHATAWIYDPEASWLDEHRQDGIDVEPLYAAPAALLKP